jgi:hypothetical protein
MAKKASSTHSSGDGSRSAAASAGVVANPADVGNPVVRSRSFAVLGLEVFVALSLSVYFFFLVGPQVNAPRSYDKNEMNCCLFTYLSHTPYQPSSDILADFDNWRARLAGPMLTGAIWDLAQKVLGDQLKPNPFRSGNVVFGGYFFNFLEVIFGMYHAIWLFLLFLLLILYRRDALLIMLGTFGGLMYNLTMPAGVWFYPWDLPTMFFFTWACLLYDRCRFLPLLLVIWLGSLFKETTLCCVLLILLGEPWPWKKRLAGFAAIILVTFLTRKLLMIAYGVQTMFFALNNAGNIYDLIAKTWLVLADNVRLFFSPTLNHALFANAGALLLMMLIPWRTRRDMLFRILAVVFVIGQFLCGIIIEFRIWYEILPLGWIVISEALTNRYGLNPDRQVITHLLYSTPDSLPLSQRLRKSYWLMPGAMLVLALGVWMVPVHRPDASAASPDPESVRKESLSPELRIRMVLANQLELEGKYEGAVQQYREVLRWDTNNAMAMNNLAWNLVVYMKPDKPTVAEAMQLATQAVELTSRRQPSYLGTLAAVYAEDGQFRKAFALEKEAQTLALSLHLPKVAAHEGKYASIYAVSKTARSAESQSGNPH